MYQDLVNKINTLLEQQEVVVVAISGHGGSGKSTLADKLAATFNVIKEQVVRIDALHAKNYMQAKDIFHHHDWPAIMEILSTIRTSDQLRYKTRDWKEIENTVEIARPRVVILEGIRLLRPEVSPYVDINVWIDCPIELATRRAIERNRLQGDSEEEIKLWDTKWVPEAREYFQQIRPDKLADFLYTDYK